MYIGLLKSCMENILDCTDYFNYCCINNHHSLYRDIFYIQHTFF